MNIRTAAIVFLVGFTAVSSHATPPAEIEVTVEQLHPKAIRVGSGKTYGDTMLAIASEKGLVVVDTGTTVRATRAYRAKIEEVFGRKDFLYVVNTHFHYDHVVGNPVFPEATVIAHELTREGIINWSRTLDEFVAQQQARVDGWLTTLETTDPADGETVRLQGLVEKYSWMSEDLRGDFEPHLPTITFSDRLHFELGDMTMGLYYFGPGTHTGDDIIESGGSLADAREQLDLGTRFAYMADLGIDKNELERQHEATVTNTWMLAKGGEDARAIAAYKKSIELDPKNTNGVAQLERLMASE